MVSTGIKSGLGCKGHNKTVMEISFLQAIRLCIRLSEAEYNDDHRDQNSGSCQDTRTLYIGYTTLMSKTNCPSKLLCFLDFQGNILRNINVSLPQGVL